MRFPVLPFALASLVPVPLLAYGAFAGGAALWAAVIYASFLAFALDEILPSGRAEGATGTEFPTAKALSVVLALGHLALVPLGVMAVAGVTELSTPERVGAFFGFGLYFGQVSNSNAHELIHRSNRHLFGLGKWVYTSMLYGHHTTAHRLLHHAHVATPLDPNFPPKGRSFYRYFLRGWVGSFVQGFRVERDRSRRSGRRNPYIDYVGGGLVLVVLCGYAFGWAGLAAYLGLCFYAQSQLAMVDYLQHYGLARRKLADGSYEPQGAHHSWNSPHWFSSHMMVNASRHSDHHANPGRIYPALRLSGEMPVLPYSLPAMGIVALIPPMWFRLMDRRVEQVLARAQGDGAA
ncbi:MAG: alkane 1-monooxygenase [Rhodobacteraceae bacterium]|nr:alkane 1-monooxygenase [Paracoccaceae bacterium]